jgi:hypothetical protein
VRLLSATTGFLLAASVTAGLGSPAAAVRLSTADDAVFDRPPLVPDETLLAGPLALPTIGVPIPGFDERYAAALLADRPAAPARQPAVPALVAAVVPEAVTLPPVEPPAPEAPAGTEEPAPEEPAVAAAPTDEQPVAGPPAEEPTDGDPPVAEPPVDEPPVDEPPAEEPPVEEPPAEEPPVEEPEPPADTTFAFGNGPTVADPAGGAEVFALVVEDVELDVPCDGVEVTGRLIGVRLRVTTGADLTALGEAPALSAADFSAGDGPVAGPDCLADGEAFPAGPLAPGQTLTGALVLDVPATAGTISYRPAFLPGTARWEF